MANARTIATAQLTGDKELLELLKALPTSLTDDVLKRAAKLALVPVAAAARATVASQSVDSGGLAVHIVVSDKLSKRQKRKYARKGDVAVYAGPTYPAAAHAHLIEFGTKDRRTKKGKFLGRVAPEPFLRPAWDNHSGKVLAIMKREIWSELVAAVKRLRGKAEKGNMSRTALKRLGK